MQEIAWSQSIKFPVLTVLQLLPVLGLVLLSFIRTRRLAMPVAILFAVAELVVAVYAYHYFDAGSAAFQFAETTRLLGVVSYHAAIDGIGMLFILLTGALSLLVIIYGPVRGLQPAGSLAMITFAIESSLMSMFSSLNLLWFACVSMVNMVLVGHMIWRWSTSPEKESTLWRYYQFTGSGLVLLFAGTLLLGHQQHGATAADTYDLFRLVANPLTGDTGTWVFFLLFYGLAIRIPLFPFHGWLPLAAEHGSVAVAPVFLVGIKVGIYGLLRFVFPVVPEAITYWQKYIVAFAFVGIFYAALLAMLQINIRRLLAYAVVSHTSILVIGMFSLSALSFQGSILLSANFGLAISALFLMTGLVYRRTRTALMSQMGSLFDRIPLIGVTFFIAGLAIIGMPGTPGFDSVHLVLEASIRQFGALVTIAAAAGNVLAAGFLLRAFQKAFLSPASGKIINTVEAEHTTPVEALIAGILIIIIVATGFIDEPWFELLDSPAKALGSLYKHAAVLQEMP